MVISFSNCTAVSSVITQHAINPLLFIRKEEWILYSDLTCCFTFVNIRDRAPQGHKFTRFGQLIM